MDYRYTSTFTSYAKILKPEEKDRFLSKASLKPLAALLPEGTDVDNNDDVLYFAADGAVAGMVNRNGDGISAASALSIYRTALNKFIDTDHDRSKIVGCIIGAGLSRFGTSEPLTDEEAAALSEPFNMAISGVIWKSVSGADQLARYLVRVGDSLDQDALSLSWEIGFSDYDIATGSKNLWDATLVDRTSERFALLDKKLRGNGGNGKDESGNEVFRVIKGNAIIVGYGIVPNPAANVKGILPITETPAPVVADSATVETASAEPVVAVTEVVTDTVKAVVSITTAEDFSITQPDTRVTPHTPPMKIESIAQIESQWTDIRKLESAAAISDFVKSIEAGSQQYVKDLETKENLSKTFEQAATAANKRATELETALAQVRKELDELRSAQASLEASTKFAERMAALDDEYELDDEDREMIASDIKDITDEAFAGYMKKCAKLMVGKKKAKPFVKKTDGEPDADDADAKKKAKAAADAAAVTTVATVIAAVASVTEIPGQSKIVNGVNVDTNTQQAIQEAFGRSFRVSGQTVAERSAAKAAKKNIKK